MRPILATLCLTACLDAPPDAPEDPPALPPQQASGAAVDTLDEPPCALDYRGSSWATAHTPGWVSGVLGEDDTTVAAPLEDGGAVLLDATGSGYPTHMTLYLLDAPASEPVADVRALFWTWVWSPGGRVLFSARGLRTFGPTHPVASEFAMYPSYQSLRPSLVDAPADPRAVEIVDLCVDRVSVEVVVRAADGPEGCAWSRTWRDVELVMDPVLAAEAACWRLGLRDDVEGLE